MRFLIFFGALLFVACASRTVQNPQASHDRIFPNGTYQHRVQVQILDGPPEAPKQLDLRGVVSVSDDEIKVVGLSPMGFTLFRLTENRQTRQVTTEIFVEALRKGQAQIERFYELLKGMLLSPDTSPHQVRGDTEFDFEKWDEHHIPQIIHIKNPHYVVTVEVTGYSI